MISEEQSEHLMESVLVVGDVLDIADERNVANECNARNARK